MNSKFGVLCEGTLIVGNSKTGVLRMRTGVSLKEAKKLAESGLYTLALAKHKTALEQYLAKQKIPRGSIQEAKRQLGEKPKRPGEESEEDVSRLLDMLGVMIEYLEGGYMSTVDPKQLIGKIEAAMRPFLQESRNKRNLKQIGSVESKRRLREASGDPIGSFIRDLERDMRAAAEIMTDVDWSKINNTSALALRVVGIDAETKKALAKMKKSGTYLQAF